MNLMDHVLRREILHFLLFKLLSSDEWVNCCSTAWIHLNACSKTLKFGCPAAKETPVNNDEGSRVKQEEKHIYYFGSSSKVVFIPNDDVEPWRFLTFSEKCFFFISVSKNCGSKLMQRKVPYIVYLMHRFFKHNQSRFGCYCSDQIRVIQPNFQTYD